MIANDLIEGAGADPRPKAATKESLGGQTADTTRTVDAKDPRRERRRERRSGGNSWSMPSLQEIEGPHARVAAIVRGATRRVAERPLTSIVAAIGIGFIVGGALSFRAGRIALAAAGRHVARQFLKQIL